LLNNRLLDDQQAVFGPANHFRPIVVRIESSFTIHNEFVSVLADWKTLCDLPHAISIIGQGRVGRIPPIELTRNVNGLRAGPVELKRDVHQVARPGEAGERKKNQDHGTGVPHEGKTVPQNATPKPETDAFHPRLPTP